MKIAIFTLPIALLLVTACSSGTSTTAEAGAQDVTASKAADLPWSVRMANSDMQRNPEGWTIDFYKEPKWEYTHGLMMSAIDQVYDRTGDQKYLEYIKNFADFMIAEDGSIKTYKKTDYNIDRVNPGKFLIELYKETGEEKYRLAIEELRDQMREHPRTAEGGFWHKKVYPNQMWLDGLYMGSPFLAKYATEFNEPAIYDDVANQIYLIDKYTWNADKQLYHHGWDESREQRWADPKTGRSPNFWGRAMGWFAMSLVDVLDYMPKDHPKRSEVLNITQKMADAIVRYQDPESGLWWQVLDHGGREGNYLESSASSMFVYFLAKATKNGYIDQKYMQDAREGYQGILKNFIEVDDRGQVTITDAVSVSGLGGNPYRDGTYEYYIGEPKRDNDPKAVGPFIMASLLMEEIDKTAAKNN